MLERKLPPRTSFVARNRAITALYARWYLQEPWLFQWAGMAAFASDQVGVALALVEMLNSPHGAVAEAALPAQEKNLLDFGLELYGRALGLALLIPLALHDTAARPLLLNDLELVKQGNDEIFADVGWAHLAYVTGGIKAIEANVCAGEQAVLEAFRMLDEGAHRLANPKDYEAGAELIRQGSVTLLRHEQMEVLPPYFERMSDLGRVLASVGAWLDFEGATGLMGQPWFGGHYGTLAIVSGGRSVTNADDRWEWIERDVLPKWARVSAAYGEHCAMHRRLLALADEAPTMLQQAAALMNIVYPALGLRAGQPAGPLQPAGLAAAGPALA
jgi:hypothetical protein